MTKLFRFVLVMACLAGVIPASAAFKDIKIDLTGQWLLTTEEFAGDPKPNVELSSPTTVRPHESKPPTHQPMPSSAASITTTTDGAGPN